MQDIFGIFPLRLVDKNGKVDKQVDKQVDKVDMVDMVDKVDMVGKDDKQGNWTSAGKSLNTLG